MIDVLSLPCTLTSASVFLRARRILCVYLVKYITCICMYSIVVCSRSVFSSLSSISVANRTTFSLLFMYYIQYYTDNRGPSFKRSSI